MTSLNVTVIEKQQQSTIVETPTTRTTTSSSSPLPLSSITEEVYEAKLVSDPFGQIVERNLKSKHLCIRELNGNRSSFEEYLIGQIQKIDNITNELINECDTLQSRFKLSTETVNIICSKK
ncbi:hypothetical protein PPL_09137 [Heterostelium album PN500]|uniref:Uncharacterized protein n=1 Tax=Heterostelium pallidum (strain ATCC 26659 / Pp 5 / PN500) TaxID=670386 RepID=D3BKQ5_HETP5|nr:hypothetical protein PPL_09137 [Heterostelium album PN500]EFA78485.1 hypothetical protein PPL_09137 [Heterostelium album PN500]|eukprot:XP_020430609.1 hypothetical protein PPL_09137 [Heterostelium album PN500]